MKSIYLLLAASVLPASAVFAQTPTEIAQMRVNMSSATSQMMQEQNAIIAAPLTGSGATANTASQVMSPTEQAQMRVNMYSATSQVRQEQDAIIAAPLSGSGAAANTAAILGAQQKIIELLEDQDITLSSQEMLLRRLERE